MTRSHARSAFVLALALCAAISTGCNGIRTNDGMSIRRNLPVEKIPGKYGQPDIIRQTRTEVGETRLFFHDEMPAEAWEGKDLVTEYYYVDRGYKLVITEDRVRDSESISNEETHEIMPLVHAQRAKRAARSAAGQ